HSFKNSSIFSTLLMPCHSFPSSDPLHIMPQGQSGERAGESSTPQKRPASASQEEEWANVDDPQERRRIQNKLAQRRFRTLPLKRSEHAQSIRNVCAHHPPVEHPPISELGANTCCRRERERA